MKMGVELANNPESNVQLIARGFNLYWASLLHVFGLALLLSLIVLLSRMLGFVANEYQVNLAYIDLYVFFIGIALYFVFTALLWRMRCVITQAHEKILDDMWVASRKIFLIVGASIVQSIVITLITIAVYFLAHFIQKQPPVYAFYMTMVLFILYFLIFVYIVFLLIFYLPLILTEDKGIFSALKKSISLVWGNWWRVFLLQITPTLAYLICLSLFSWMFRINIDIYLSYAPQHIFATVINLFLIALIIPLNGAFLLVQLRDLELRKAVSYTA